MRRELLGERFSALRKRNGLTQNQLAEYLEVDQSYVSKCEKNERQFSVDILEKSLVLFGCEMESFLNGSFVLNQLPIAFRTNQLTTNDLKTISIINSVALNLRYMEKLLKEDYNEGEN